MISTEHLFKFAWLKCKHVPWSRVIISTLFGLIITCFCYQVLKSLRLGAGDLASAMPIAKNLIAGRDPYSYCGDAFFVPYPLTAVLIVLPFAWLTDEFGAALFFGLSSALLAFGVTKHGYARLLIFLSYPYLAALITAQWSPLLMAVAFFPVLLPLTMAKPHIGFPIAVTNLTRRGVLMCALFALLSLAVMPTWPLRWLGQIGEYRRFVPLLTWPGLLLPLALIRYRDKDARLLLLAALIPQRWAYDAFILWLIPKKWPEILPVSLLSWGVAIWIKNTESKTIEEAGTVTVLCCYIPMLLLVLLRRRPQSHSEEVSPDATQPLPNS